MKVYIGPYKNWIGPYQIADKFEWLIGEAKAYEFGEWLSKTKLNDLCKWIDEKRKRKISIHIDSYDVWGADHTLALIIHPVLLKLKEHKQGNPYVDDEDVPENIRSTAAPPLTEEEKLSGHLDEFFDKRWDWVLDEMIWTFSQHMEDDWEEQYCSGESNYLVIEGQLVNGPNHTFKVDSEGIKKHRKRMDNGRRLFAKYYESLWD
jgi:hypothetical protein